MPTRWLAFFFLTLMPGFQGVPRIQAMQVEGYTPARHDRFTSGYTTDPVSHVVPNTDPNFIGAPYNLSGVLWNAANRKQSFVFLSRRHYLYANHFGPGTNLQYFSNVTGLGQATRLSQVALPDTDIGIARLNQLIPASAQVAIYPLLNLPTNASYVGRELLMAGWFGRFGKSEMASVLPDGRLIGGSVRKYLFEHEPPQGRADFVRLEGEDSGSPSFIPFQNELTLTGNHFYILGDGNGNYAGGGDSFPAFPEVVGQLNSVLAEDGFALRFRTEPAKNWVGSSNGNWSGNFNWSGFSSPGSTQAVGFAGSVTQKNISLGNSRTVRGILFTGSTGQTGYTFQAGQTLTIGYVGIRNDAPVNQTFNNTTALGGHQHWTASGGNLTFAGPVILSSHTLSLGGSQAIFLNNSITGTGGLSVQEGITRLTGTASHTGTTWIYGGTLHLLGPGQLPAGTPLVLGGGTLLVDATDQTTGPLRLLDDSIIRFQGGSASLIFSSSSAQTWTPGKLLTIANFDPVAHHLQIGNDFNSITPGQRAVIRFAGVPAFHAGAGVLRPAGAFEQWQLQFFPQEAGNPATEATLWGGQAQPAGDGAPNLLKYALGLPPAQPVGDQLPAAEINSDGYLQIAIPRNPVATDVNIIVESSPDLLEWKSGAGNVVILQDTPILLVVRDAVLVEASEARFLRFRVVPD